MRFDQNYDIDYSFCPTLLTPLEYCTALRNGNPFFESHYLSAANKEDLVKHAKDRDASDKVMQDIENLPDKEYTSAADVSKEFKGN